MISRRLPASSSFVLAAARLRALQLDSCGTAGSPGSCEEDLKNRQAKPEGSTEPPGQVRTLS
jgi:hypothetical protein